MAALAVAAQIIRAVRPAAQAIPPVPRLHKAITAAKQPIIHLACTVLAAVAARLLLAQAQLLAQVVQVALGLHHLFPAAASLTQVVVAVVVPLAAALVVLAVVLLAALQMPQGRLQLLIQVEAVAAQVPHRHR